MSEPDFAAGFDPRTFGDIGLPIAMMYRAIAGMRPLLANDDEGISPALVDAAFTQAHVLSLAEIIAHGHTDEDQDEQLIAEITGKLRETVAIARLMR